MTEHTPAELDGQIESQFNENERLHRTKTLEILQDASIKMEDLCLKLSSGKKIGTGAKRGSDYFGVSTNGIKW